MGISIRDREVGELARELANLRRTNMTEAIAYALRSELKRERDKQSLVERLEKLADETVAMGRPGGHVMTKDEIDELWGQ
jgi:antitoxin VapB